MIRRNTSTKICAIVAAGIFVTLCCVHLLAQGAPGATITGVNEKTGVVVAKVNSTGQVFEFTLANKAELTRVHAGQGIFVNLGKKQVSLDGKSISGTIIDAQRAAAGSTPGLAARTRTIPAAQSKLQIVGLTIDTPCGGVAGYVPVGLPTSLCGNPPAASIAVAPFGSVSSYAITSDFRNLTGQILPRVLTQLVVAPAAGGSPVIVTDTLTNWGPSLPGGYSETTFSWSPIRPGDFVITATLDPTATHSEWFGLPRDEKKASYSATIRVTVPAANSSPARLSPLPLGVPGVGTISEPTDLAVEAPLDLLTGPGAVMIRPPDCSGDYAVSCDASGKPVSSAIQFTRRMPTILHSKVDSQAGSYTFSAVLSPVTPNDIPVLVMHATSCAIRLQTSSVPLVISGTLNLTSTATAGSTPIYAAAFTNLQSSGFHSAVTVTSAGNCPSTFVGSLPDNWLLDALFLRSCATVGVSGPVLTQCPNGTGTTTQPSTSSSSYPVSPIMINEFGVYYDSATNATPSFLEIYNGSDKDYDLKGCSLSYRLSGQATDTATTTFAQSTRVPAHGYYVQMLGQALLPGVLILRKGDPSSGAVLDAVAYGGALNPFFSTSGAAGDPFTRTSAALARSPNGTNTNNNQADFRFTTAPTPGAPNQ